MFATRIVTARQIVEMFDKGEKVSFAIDAYTHRDVIAAYPTGNGGIYARCSDGGYNERRPNDRVAIVDWPTTHEAWDAEAQAEQAAELAAERYFEEGPHGPQDDPRERALWALEDEAAAMRAAAR